MTKKNKIIVAAVLVTVAIYASYKMLKQRRSIQTADQSLAELADAQLASLNIVASAGPSNPQFV